MFTFIKKSWLLTFIDRNIKFRCILRCPGTHSIIMLVNAFHREIHFFSKQVSVLHTYIIGLYNHSVKPLQPFSQDYGLASLITHIVWVNFICEWWYLQFNVGSERQLVWETFSWQVYFLSEFLADICGKVITEEIYSVFHFWWLTWYTNSGFCD